VKADVREGQGSDALQFAIDLHNGSGGLSREQVLDAIARRLCVGGVVG
jgi:hypothetical protein